MSVAERTLMETELVDMIEGEFSLPVTVILPSGVQQTMVAMITYDWREETPDGQMVVVHDPLVTIRRSTWTTKCGAVPIGREGYFMRIPTDAISVSTTTFSIVQAPEQNRTIGMIRFRLTKAVQT